MRTLQVVVLLVFALIIGRLAYIQLIDSRYGDLARANVLRHVVQYPPRGEVFDRNGEYLVQSRECYDLMVISSEIDKRGFDTARLCEVLEPPAGEARTGAGQCADAAACAAPRDELHLQGRQTALRRVQLPGILRRLPHRAAVSPRGGRQPAGVCQRGERRLPETPSGLQDRRLRGHGRRGVGLRAGASGHARASRSRRSTPTGPSRAPT